MTVLFAIQTYYKVNKNQHRIELKAKQHKFTIILYGMITTRRSCWVRGALKCGKCILYCKIGVAVKFQRHHQNAEMHLIGL